ncbi:MAG: dihydroneopterin aldolase, partial [Aphanizomenon sp.]
AIANAILQESSLTTQVQVILIKPAAPIPDFDGNIRIELTRSKSNL